MTNKLNLACDYNQGAHPAILKQMLENNLVKSGVYGEDAFSESAKARIREACKAPEADVWFLVGGTQTNAVVLDSVLRPYEGVISVETGHICIHEAGAIERGGHKILAVKGRNGKLSATDILACWDTWESDGNRDHVVKPGAVYLSNPTELGTLYTLRELEDISSVCRDKGLCLYVDGARLAYALACPENDITMPDLARLCDVFYIAKGFVAGIQFDALFTDNLYGEIGRTAIAAAERIRRALQEKGYTLASDAPTNQIFVLLDQKKLEELSEKVEMSFWDKPDAEHTTMRFVTSWATTDEEVDRLIALL